MYRVFIADDELYVRNGLKKHFPWNKYDIEVVGEAGNGKEALEKILAGNIDIVITDVLMPLLDGIELAKALREKGCNSKVIFISGYDDIEYLRSALKLDAIDYIMKSIDLDELAETIKKVIRIIDKERSEKDLHNQMKAQLEQSMPLLREKLLKTLIKDSAESLMLEEKIGFAGLDLKGDGSYFVCIASLENFYSLYMGKSEAGRQLLTFGMLNTGNELLQRHLKGYMFESSVGEFAAIIIDTQNYNSDPLSSIEKFFNEVRDMFKKYYNVQVSTGYSGPVHGFIHLKACYEEAVRMAAASQTADTLKSSTYDFSSREQDLISALGSSGREIVYQILEDIFRNTGPSDMLPNMQNSLFSLLMLPADMLSEMALTKETPYNDIRRLCEQFFLCGTITETYDYIRNLYDKILRAIELKREDQTDAIITRMKTIMNERYASDLLLSDIAKEVFLTPTYICLLFKQKTGITVNEYLTALRINKAKELLTDSQKKLYEICCAVGYTSPCYFTKLFKRCTGFTPSEYRDITTDTVSGRR